MGSGGLDRDRTTPAAESFGQTAAPAGRALSPAARRALAEAEARRRAAEDASPDRPREVNGRGGQEPIRYGDWEVKGLATDF